MIVYIPLTISPSLFLVGLHQPLEKQLPVTATHLGAPVCDCGSDSGQTEGFHLIVSPLWLQGPRCSFFFSYFFFFKKHFVDLFYHIGEALTSDQSF